ncbi:MAG: FAD-dependent monooxygenase [Ktedonobacterales bacterium]
MKVGILGGGPAGLYCGVLLKKAGQKHDVSIIERNPPGATYGWGVVFSDRTLAAFQEADYPSYHAITNRFVLWDAIDIHYQGQLIRCGGHVFAGLERKLLLQLLQARCRELGVSVSYNTELTDISELDGYDLVVAADGAHSLVRSAYAKTFQPSLISGKAKFIWLGTDKVLDAFTFIFRENEHGLFQVHAYPFSGYTSTFIVECSHDTWQRAGLDTASPEESIAYCERLFAPELHGARLLSNNSRWTNFATVKNARWHHQKTVLLGDAAHTAHFSIGSGTKLAMEDAIALVHSLEAYSDLETALSDYEVVRKPVIEVFQTAAGESQAYFESVKRYTGLSPLEFSFNLLTRSGRLAYDDLRLRDPHFGESVDRWFQDRYRRSTAGDSKRRLPELIATQPALAPLPLRGVEIVNRVAQSPRCLPEAEDGVAGTGYLENIRQQANAGAGLVMTGSVAVTALGRITPECPGAYQNNHLEYWRDLVERLHATTVSKLGITLNHAGRRGAVRPPSEGLDRALRSGGWPLISASAIPFSPRSQRPAEISLAAMMNVCEAFVRSARLAEEAGFDVLQLHMGHGYLLASFLSPLTNLRTDSYGGSLPNRQRFPLEVFRAVRAVWPESRPLAVALNGTDGASGGLEISEGVEIAAELKAHGCDLLTILAGQVVPESDLTYGPGFLTSLSDRIRNEVGIATLVGGYLTTSNQVNTILAGGRADLCLMYPRS